MAGISDTFSESWHRVANQRVSLHPGVRVSRQRFRGERWYVLENPFSNQFFRLRPAAYSFVAQLGRERSVESVWRACLDQHPEEAPGQEAVVRLLGQLYRAGLLLYADTGDVSNLFEQQQKRQQREIRSRLMNLMFVRIPLFDPDRLLVAGLPWVRPFISWFGALLWMLLGLVALKTLVDHWPSLVAEGREVLAPSNLLWLYLGMIVTKTFHEFGHAFFCRRFGGEVHVMGVMLLIFTPVPFMDATSSWRFRNRNHRMLVAGAGMLVELFIAFIAVVVWARTGSGTVHTLAYNMIFVASVSTLLFNINPLLRFDGYYILSDWLQIPNLHQRSTKQLRHLFEHHLFGVTNSESPGDTTGERWWLSVFGVASWAYRVVLFAGILLFVADRYLLLGIIMAGICVVSWLIVPLGRFANYLLTSPRLDRCRPRAVFASAALGLLLITPLKLVSFPANYRAPGVLAAAERSQTVNETTGVVRELFAQSGQRVIEGQPLMRLENFDLGMDITETRSRLEEMEARRLFAQQADPGMIEPLTVAMGALQARLNRLLEDRERLIVRAGQSGIWVAPNATELLGRWLKRGTPTGWLLVPESIVFTATVSQTDADSLFQRTLPISEVRLNGQGAITIDVEKLEVVPGEQRELPSSALGQGAGGTVPVAPDDSTGRRAREAFFEVRAYLQKDTTAVLYHGRSGTLRVSRPAEPLLDQGWRRLRQLVQERYRF